VFSVDVRSLAALRIALGGLLLVNLGDRARYLDVNYTDQGVLPREALGTTLSLHALGGGIAFEACLFAVAALFAAMLFVGYRTRVATVASWLLLISLHNRNPPLLDGGDVLLGTLLLWSMFLPLGGCWSLDARRVGGGSATTVFSAATVALLLQFVSLYLLGGLLKTGPDWRSTGAAIQLALEQSWWSLPRGQFLLRYPGLLRMMSLAVPWFEIIGSLLMFVPVWTGPVRMVTIAAFALFQLGLGWCIQLHLFPWVCTAAALPFIPSSFWDRVARPPHPAAEPRARAGWLREAPVTLLLLYSVVASLHGVGLVNLPPRVREVAHALGVIQGWTMYAPQSAHVDLRFQTLARRADGGTADLVADAPERIQRLYGTRRFKYFLEDMLRGPEQVRRRQYYLRWVCRRWAPEEGASLVVWMRDLPQTRPWQQTLLMQDDCRGQGRS
jgi:hypothetical protein